MPRWSLLLATWVGLTLSLAPPQGGRAAWVTFTAAGREAGLNATIVFGKRETNTYLIETTGTGVAMLDYDADGWIDLFFVNGSTLEGFKAGEEPTNRLYRNRRNGTFEDVTAGTGLAASGWGQGTCAGDYDNDGFTDLAVTYWGQNRLYHNDGRGRFEDVTQKAGLRAARRRWGTGCAFVDYDRDGRLDLFTAHYVDFDPASTPRPDAGLCRYRGLPVACGPSGLPPARNALYRNRGDGTFADVSERAGITRTSGIYALGVSTMDFDNDGWTDLYVAGDSSASVLYRNNRDGTFTDVAAVAGCAFSGDGRAQAGMGVAVGDYDRNGSMDVFKTNFAGDTSTLYANSGQGVCEDRTFAAGLGVNTRWLGWGAAFADFDNDGWLDLLSVNGHVYPEVRQLRSEAGYEQPKVLYRNLRNGRFQDVTAQVGGPLTIPKAARGAAFGDVDNDGWIDVAIANVNDRPDLYRAAGPSSNRWIAFKLVG
ncbi:MAG TPA: VCBS repeat-containing protein, partial [Vicinamibacterales bacterium]|nr:VCBS repeat-containing protein [Vicinamibacterales bacterium]